MLFSAVILAGGQSRRMGRDKAWLEVDGQPLILRQIHLARQVGAAGVFISGRPGRNYSKLKCPVLKDKFRDAGPLAGIERALHKIGSPFLLVLAVDLPHLTPSVLRLLLAQCTAQTGAIPRVNGQIEPLAAFYPRNSHSLAVSLLSAGNNAVRGFAQQCVQLRLGAFVDLSPSAAATFSNWNEPTDLA
jgi:molybdenum cofactor guanylyltransferase